MRERHINGERERERDLSRCVGAYHPERPDVLVMEGIYIHFSFRVWVRREENGDLVSVC